jgi:hypothetical protein
VVSGPLPLSRDFMRIHRLLVSIVAAAVLAGCGGGKPAAGPSPAVYSPGPGVVVHSDLPSPSPPVLTWRNCDPAKSGVMDRDREGCATSFGADTCQASKYSDAQGDLLDAYIENRLEVDEAALGDCPQFLPTWNRAKTGFTDGTHLVPDEVKPGTYETTAHLSGGRVTDCYWERNRGGKILDNNLVAGAKSVKVTVRQGDETLVTRGCGDWVRV